MRSVLVVVVQASPHNCESCGKPLEGFLAQHVCPSCGWPQKLVVRVLANEVGEDYFSALGVPPKFIQDRAELEKNFYAVSRLLHPDRFTTAPLEAQRQSLERMSFLNEAYRTLRDPEARRLFVLRLEGVSTDPHASSQFIPAELAEDWFDLQDQQIQEKAQIEQFELKLRSFKEKSAQNVAKIEEGLDSLFDGLAEHSQLASRSVLLQELLKAIHAQSYLKSLEKDVERLKARVFTG